MRNNLYTLLKADEKQVRKIVTKTLKANGYEPVIEDDFIYAEGTVPVLLIAHYDTVAKSPRFIKNDRGVLSGWMNNKPHQLGADDRAGIYAILETIPKHHCHVLFTGGEEIGGVGATAFTNSGIKPDVNYCLQFDRRGSNDAVYYWAYNKDFEDFVASKGWKKAEGTFTDIVTICPYLGVMGVNLSIGYSKEHTIEERLDTAILNKNIKRIAELLDGERYEYEEDTRYSFGNYGLYGRRSLYGNFYDPEGYEYSAGYDDGFEEGYNTALEEYELYGTGRTYYGAKRYGSREDKQRDYFIQFVGKDGQLTQAMTEAPDYYSAIGKVLVEYDYLSYSDIVTCTLMDDKEVYYG